jgi:hypothetical protein
MLAESLRRHANRNSQPKIQMRAIRGDCHNIKLGACSHQAPANLKPFIE